MSLAEVIKAKMTTRQTFLQVSTSRDRQLGWHPKINSGWYNRPNELYVLLQGMAMTLMY